MRSRGTAPLDLTGKRALITGASGGLGTAIARALAERGASLIVTGRQRDALDNLVRALDAEMIVCDVAKPDELAHVLDAAVKVDVLVSNAGIPASGALQDFSVEQIDRAIAVNLRAPLLLARAASAAMADRGFGHIVFVSSISAKLPGRAQALYSATKAGLRASALAIREDLHGTGVTVSVVLPGPVSDAGMWAETGLAAQAGKMKQSRPSDVADAVLAAMTRNRAEIDVMSAQLRFMSALALLRPSWAAAMTRKGSKEFAAAMVEAHRHKW
ncbi:MAG TPA: SDR family NAD(P)-dependent oxidoreductase [Mycobacteriales bacterium]|jgi:short-subunit dehydrogenase|nr:SDR family NAD(P)-dependent oxidoreductase [Mycobacteriales bacterium]